MGNFWIALFSLLVAGNALQTTVKVCSNKHCCKQFQGKLSLAETLNDLVLPEAAGRLKIEPSGCLSNCGKGPNICIAQNGEQVVNGLVNAASAKAQLDLMDATHSTLLAAVNVMEKAERGTCRFYVAFGDYS